MTIGIKTMDAMQTPDIDVTHEASRPRKLVQLPCVREYAEGMPVELWINKNNRLVLRAYNEDGCNYTEVDVLDIFASYDLNVAFCCQEKLGFEGEIKR